MTETQKKYQKAFEQALKENPCDISTRLIYSDWLEEQGLDDEAQEERRKATPDWVDAYKYMEDFASRCGETCVNYNENYFQHRDETTGLSYHREEDRNILEAAGERMRKREDLQLITCEQCIQAGFDYLERGDYFVQMGSERARNIASEERETYWKNWSIITGVSLEDKDVDEDTSAPFSCSC